MATVPRQKTPKTTTNQSETPLSLVIAKNKLKEVEDKIYEARNRIDILNKRYQKRQTISLNRTRAEGFRQSIRDFSSRNKSVKYDYLNRRSAEVMNYHQKNMERRNEHKQKILQMKEMIQTQNKWVYEHIRKQKQMNLRSINKAKEKQQDDKRKRRDQMFQNSQRRIAYLKEYMKNKHLTAKLQKEEEAQQIQAKILQREKLLQKLERKGSQLSVNPQQTEKSRSIDKSSRSATKGFRVNSKKNMSALQQ